MIFGEMKPEEVFTPRSAEVNSEMYVSRPSLERALQRALRGNLHMIIHGESGTGKSWLYKKTFRDARVPFIVANLANASRLGSIAAELKNIVDREGHAVKTSFEEEKSAEVTALVAKAGVLHTAQYQVGQMEPFEACLFCLRNHANNNPAVLVFDNLEAAFSEKLLKELADLLILCDDERYAKYKVKILIVGVPSNVKEYFYKTPHHSTVANRLDELPEVARLEKVECEALVKRGFAEKLKFMVPDLDEVVNHVAWISDRVPQIVHEYCLELAYLSEESRVVTQTQVSEADDEWLSKSQYHAYSVVESHMNERDTKAGRRNQTLYALSLCEGEQFKAPEIEELVRKEFPSSTGGKALNLPQMLSQLSGGERPIVRRSPKGDAFTFSDPRYRMVLRAMLKKEADEKVEKRPISR
ncbi:MAG: ATP-binding protein [Methylococcales bacterium]|nr:ATP-binding protein [Methylococcales bacterium]